MTRKHVAVCSFFALVIAAGCVVVSEKPADSAPPPPAATATDTAPATATATTATEMPGGPVLHSPPRGDAGTGG
jgi:hypothetical protein